MGHSKQQLDPVIKRRQTHARRLYTIYNNRYFSGTLPSLPIYVRPIRSGSWAETHFSFGSATEVYLSPVLWLERRRLLTPVLLHEMIHVKLGEEETCWKPGRNPSPAFQLETIRLSKLGALMDII